jgi:hypothetical protein
MITKLFFFFNITMALLWLLVAVLALVNAAILSISYEKPYENVHIFITEPGKCLYGRYMYTIETSGKIKRTSHMLSNQCVGGEIYQTITYDNGVYSWSDVPEIDIQMYQVVYVVNTSYEFANISNIIMGYGEILTLEHYSDDSCANITHVVIVPFVCNYNTLKMCTGKYFKPFEKKIVVSNTCLGIGCEYVFPAGCVGGKKWKYIELYKTTTARSGGMRLSMF